jgi:hypothetical protein
VILCTKIPFGPLFLQSWGLLLFLVIVLISGLLAWEATAPLFVPHTPSPPSPSFAFSYFFGMDLMVLPGPASILLFKPPCGWERRHTLPCLALLIELGSP